MIDVAVAACREELSAAALSAPLRARARLLDPAASGNPDVVLVVIERPQEALAQVAEAAAAAPRFGVVVVHTRPLSAREAFLLGRAGAAALVAAPLSAAMLATLLRRMLAAGASHLGK